MFGHYKVGIDCDQLSPLNDTPVADRLQIARNIDSATMLHIRKKIWKYRFYRDYANIKKQDW